MFTWSWQVIQDCLQYDPSKRSLMKKIRTDLSKLEDFYDNDFEPEKKEDKAISQKAAASISVNAGNFDSFLNLDAPTSLNAGESGAVEFENPPITSTITTPSSKLIKDCKKFHKNAGESGAVEFEQKTAASISLNAGESGELENLPITSSSLKINSRKDVFRK